MSTIAKENLDERIERIKKRNEEIEKKYREAEEDRLQALKENAMVETKPPKDEDWPRTHKYDKLDFTYDVKRDKLEELNNQNPVEDIKQKRDYKKFPEGEGPPPDPAYNFLADAERDGLIINKQEKNGNKDIKQNNKSKDQQRRGGPNAGSFRGRGGKAHSPKYQKQNSQPEYEQWRNEREKIDEARISRQKVGEGKWRREWDNDKLNSENQALSRSERPTMGDTIVAAKKSPTHNQGNVVEKRGNITVSVSQTGEVKSVKLTSTPVIGTGRVGPRQLSKPQFAIQALEKEVVVKSPHSPKPQQKFGHRQNTNPSMPPNQNNKNVLRRDMQSMVINTNQIVANNQILHQGKNLKPQKPKSPKFPRTTGTTPTIPQIAPGVISPLIADISSESATELIAIDLSHKPEFAKKSVQDRLLRIRQGSSASEVAPTSPPVTDLNASANERGDSPNSVVQSSDGVVQSADGLVQSADGVEQSLDAVVQSPDGALQSSGAGEKSADSIEQSPDAMVQSPKLESGNIQTAETSNKDEKANEGEEEKFDTESNTISCDPSLEPLKSFGAEQVLSGNCDKNNLESIVEVTMATEGDASN